MHKCIHAYGIKFAYVQEYTHMIYIYIYDICNSAGKSTLVKAACHHMRKHPDCVCHVEVLVCSQTASTQRQKIDKEKPQPLPAR